MKLCCTDEICGKLQWRRIVEMKRFLAQAGNIAYLVKPYWKYGKAYSIISFFVAAIISPLDSIAGVLFTQTVIDAVAAGATFGGVIAIIVRFLLVLLFTLIIRNAYDVLYSGYKLPDIQQKINLEIYHKVLKTDYKYFDNPEFFDDYTWAINEYAAKSAEAYNLIMRMLQSISTIISMVSIIVILGPGLIAITIIEMAVTIFFETRRNKLNIKKQEEILPLDRRLGYTNRVFYQKEYAADIKVTNVRRYLLALYDESGKKKLETIKKYSTKLLAWLYAQNFIAIAYNAAIMAYISYGMIVSKRIVGVGKFMGLITANSQLVTSLYGFFGFVSQANNLNLYAAKIKVFFDVESKIENRTNGIADIPAEPFEVRIENLSYVYENSNFGLHNINLLVKPGDKIAIVGENGAGKTTLVKLLLHLYQPQTGNIFYNSHPIEDYNVAELRSKIGTAFQAANVYALSLAENLRIYKDMTKENLDEIVKKLELTKVLSKSKGSLDTELTREFDQNGIILSAGETQKISIGRIMSREFGLLILDEPSSTLDPLTEYNLTSLLYNEANKTTTILIAHRLSMVREADCIYVMNNGTICESGCHDELMEKKGLYYEMFVKQSEKYSK